MFVRIYTVDLYFVEYFRTLRAYLSETVALVVCKEITKTMSFVYLRRYDVSGDEQCSRRYADSH